MTTFDSFKLEWETRLRISDDVWKHNLQLDEWGYWSKSLNGINSNQSFKQALSRARMFSPSSWVKNIREFQQNVLESRRTESIKISMTRCQERNKDSKIDTQYRADPKQLEIILNIHRHLILKTSKLVEKAKRSQFGGFFYPRILRKRIKLGNLSQLPWGLQVIKRRAFSPWEKLAVLNRQSNFINKDEAKKNQFITQNSISNKDTTNRVALKYDFILNSIKNNDKAKKLKSVSEKYQNMLNKDASAIDDDFFWIQQKIKSNFSL